MTWVAAINIFIFATILKFWTNLDAIFFNVLLIRWQCTWISYILQMICIALFLKRYCDLAFLFIHIGKMPFSWMQSGWSLTWLLLSDGEVCTQAVHHVKKQNTIKFWNNVCIHIIKPLYKVLQWHLTVIILFPCYSMQNHVHVCK